MVCLAINQYELSWMPHLLQRLCLLLSVWACLCIMDVRMPMTLMIATPKSRVVQWYASSNRGMYSILRLAF